MKTYHCELTNTRIFYNENDTFKVFIRRSNCPKKLIKVTNDPAEAVRAYHSVKLFYLDRAYIFVDAERKLIRSGTEQKPYSLRGFKRPPNFKRKTFATPNMPETAYNSLLSLENITLNGSKGLSMSKAVILMACKLASMSPEEKIDFLNTCVTDYKTHLELSGCDNVDLDEYIENEFGKRSSADAYDLL